MPPCRLLCRNEVLPTGAVPCQEGFVGLDVISRHARGGKTMLERLPNPDTAHRIDPTGRGDRLIHGLNDEATDTIADHFWHGAVAESNHRCAADIASIITRPKGSGQSIGNSSARACPRKIALGAFVDLANELDQGMVEQRWNDLLEVGLVGPVDLGGDLQRHASLRRNVNGSVRPLFR